MTAQIGDSLLYEGNNYTIAALSKSLNFNPTEYGLIPKPICSGCWNGYWCNYKICDSEIFLDTLFINCKSEYPPVNGKSFVCDDKGKPVECLGQSIQEFEN